MKPVHHKKVGCENVLVKTTRSKNHKIRICLFEYVVSPHISNTIGALDLDWKVINQNAHYGQSSARLVSV